MESNNTGITNPQTEAGKTILVVDDNEMVCLLIKSILEKQYKVVLKGDGQDALAYLNQGNRPNLILLDMLMPKMNGRTFVRKVSADPRLGKIPIIFITTVDSTMLMNSFKDLVVGYIVKPFEKDDLLRMIEGVLK